MFFTDFSHSVVGKKKVVKPSTMLEIDLLRSHQSPQFPEKHLAFFFAARCV